MNNHDDHLCRSKNCSSCHSILSVIGSIRYIRFRWFDWVSPLMIVIYCNEDASNQMSLSWNATFWHKKISNKHWNSMFNVWYFASSCSCHETFFRPLQLAQRRPSHLFAFPLIARDLIKITYDLKILFPKPPWLRPGHSQANIETFEAFPAWLTIVAKHSRPSEFASAWPNSSWWSHWCYYGSSLWFFHQLTKNVRFNVRLSSIMAHTAETRVVDISMEMAANWPETVVFWPF